MSVSVLINRCGSFGTCLISFSISPARITNGPRTAYSILMTFGFIESNVNALVTVDAIVRLLLRSNSTDDRMGFVTAAELKQLNWRWWFWADRRLLLRALLLNTVFKQRLLIMFVPFCWLCRLRGVLNRCLFLSVICKHEERNDKIQTLINSIYLCVYMLEAIDAFDENSVNEWNLMSVCIFGARVSL